LTLALVAALLFAGLCGVRLTTQGITAEEVLEIAAAFVYTGSPLDFGQGSYFAVHGIPVLVDSYIGAIKPALYGLYMVCSGNGFSILSMRLLGISLACVGFFVFCFVAVRRMSPLWLVIFTALFLTDVSLLILVRYDRASSAIGLLFRLLFLATWVVGEWSGAPRPRNSFFLAFWAGVALFQKLINFTLVFPLLLTLCLNPARRNRGHFLAACAGGDCGGRATHICQSLRFHHSGFLRECPAGMLGRKTGRLGEDGAQCTAALAAKMGLL